MYTRSLLHGLRDALDDTPVLLVQGARQTGKTTLVEALGRELDATYQSLDDTTTLAAVRADPGGFLAAHASRTLILDEVQRLPELFLSMKVEVDRGRRPGRFLLTLGQCALSAEAVRVAGGTDADSHALAALPGRDPRHGRALH